jgi:hypothetical protein
MKLTRVTRGTAASALVLAALTGCGGGDKTATDSSGTSGAAAAETPAAGAGAGGLGGGPGASGTVAAVTGTTMQVQSDAAGQVAVSWSADTTFLQQVDGTLADVAVGTCVMVTSDAETTEGDPVAATAVRITESQDDGCTGGFGGGPGSGRPTDLPTDLPTDRPTDPPEGMPSGGPGGGFGGGTFGEVTAVSGSGFTVESGDDTVEVTVDGATTYSTTAAATAAAVEVGRCAVAVGEADDTGAVAATTINLSDPVDGECTTGLRGGFGGGAPEDAS